MQNESEAIMADWSAHFGHSASALKTRKVRPTGKPATLCFSLACAQTHRPKEERVCATTSQSLPIVLDFWNLIYAVSQTHYEAARINYEKVRQALALSCTEPFLLWTMGLCTG